MVEKQFRMCVFQPCQATIHTKDPVQPYSASDEDFRAHKAIFTLLANARTHHHQAFLSRTQRLDSNPILFASFGEFFAIGDCISSEPEFQRLSAPPPREKNLPTRTSRPASCFARLSIPRCTVTNVPMTVAFPWTTSLRVKSKFAVAKQTTGSARTASWVSAGGGFAITMVPSTTKI